MLHFALQSSAHREHLATDLPRLTKSSDFALQLQPDTCQLKQLDLKPSPNPPSPSESRQPHWSSGWTIQSPRLMINVLPFTGICHLAPMLKTALCWYVTGLSKGSLLLPPPWEVTTAARRNREPQQQSPLACLLWSSDQVTSWWGWNWNTHGKAPGVKWPHWRLSAAFLDDAVKLTVMLIVLQDLSMMVAGSEHDGCRISPLPLRKFESFFKSSVEVGFQ